MQLSYLLVINLSFVYKASLPFWGININSLLEISLNRQNSTSKCSNEVLFLFRHTCTQVWFTSLPWQHIRQLTLGPSQQQTCDIPVQTNNCSSHDNNYQFSKLNICQGYPYPNVSCMILISCWRETEISALENKKFACMVYRRLQILARGKSLSSACFYVFNCFYQHT